ncbi:hypothetical protein PVK06_007217 [Gossypium arboreum]|uniref:Uncharacterized protein n=1 Tax=Gossypium arboreum TaxID=29729 RepID=A0ABR0QHM2_GOSAR|nr:hypothetical protein PVK06_007217 [Gossypium arboreum]
MDRSPRFGSISSDNCPMKTRFRYGSDVSVRQVVSCLPMDSAAVRRLTYSGISGSTLIFNSPKHFVAYYALPRLWVPRYPPKTRNGGELSPLRLFGLKNAGFKNE